MVNIIQNIVSIGWRKVCLFQNINSQPIVGIDQEQKFVPRYSVGCVVSGQRPTTCRSMSASEAVAVPNFSLDSAILGQGTSHCPFFT